MDHVFAPWRIEWVKRVRPSDDECVFCSLPASGADRNHRIVARSDHSYVLLNNAPYNPGHVMVIPFEHTGDYRTLSDEQLRDHARLKQRTIEAFETTLEPDGLNVGMNLGTAAGGSIGDHIHTHLVPRWEGDTNFMAVVSETKVIVEGLDATYEKLREGFSTQADAVETPADEAIRFDDRES